VAAAASRAAAPPVSLASAARTAADARRPHRSNGINIAYPSGYSFYVTVAIESTPAGVGSGRAKTGGRSKGTPNRATRAVKEFLSGLLEQPDVQDAIRDRILKGDTSAFFKALEFVIGKPRQTVEQGLTGPIEIRWKDDLVERLEAGRRRAADALQKGD
jgi:hypothetical protein